MIRNFVSALIIFCLYHTSVQSQIVTGVDPNCGIPGNSYGLTITGSGTEWTLSSYYVVVFSGEGLSAFNVQIVNDSVLTADLNISPSAALGLRDMDVLDQFNNSYFLQNAFTVATICNVNVNQTNGTTPNDFSLGNNFPNPFNPITRINFSLPVSQDVTFYVFDLKGSIIAEINLGKKSAGQFEIIYDASKLPSGTYFYGIRTNKFSQFKKMVVIK